MHQHLKEVYFSQEKFRVSLSLRSRLRFTQTFPYGKGQKFSRWKTALCLLHSEIYFVRKLDKFNGNYL